MGNTETVLFKIESYCQNHISKTVLKRTYSLWRDILNRDPLNTCTRVRCRWIMSSYRMQITKREYISITWRALLRDFLWCQVLTVKVPKSNLLKLFLMVIHKKSRNLYSQFCFWNFLKLGSSGSSQPFNPQISKICL